MGATLVGIITGTIITTTWQKKFFLKQLVEEKQMSQKHLDLYLLMNQWVKIKQDGKDIGTYLKERNFSSVAVYGLSYVGQTLVEELKNGEVHVKYGIDRKANGDFEGLKVYKPEEELPNVDVVIVTSIAFMPEIEERLSQKMSCPIISIEDILYML